MPRSRILILASLLVLTLLAGTAQAIGAQTRWTASKSGAAAMKMGKTTLAQRRAAAKRMAVGIAAAAPGSTLKSFGAPSAGLAALDPNATPNYFAVPNYALSPLPALDGGGNPIGGTGIRKFVDSLAGLGPSGANNLGNYIPVATANTTAYPGSDYYIIAVCEYTQKLHSDLPPTKLRGYVQLSSNGTTLTPPSYLGPAVVATKDKPVRVKFINKLPTGAGGDLFLPVDTTMMGAGEGPLGAAGGNYKQNRATLHLHGGKSIWISDGTPHQWTTPAGENTPYPKGVSVKDVPDMPATGPGEMTFFYSNQQSARLLFYHDHAYGITRLNVYAGEAAPYVITDPVENALVNGGSFSANGTTVTVPAGTVPQDMVPLVFQDKTFVPDDTQLEAQDPTWNKAKWGGKGNLWFPHVYMPNQNPEDLSGVNPMGRWDYGPWFFPPFTGLANGPIPNPYAGQPGQPSVIPGTPTPSAVPEAFMDTPVVNGTAYPHLTVGRKAYRFRILNACNDRFLNLQIYKASSNATSTDASGSPLHTGSGEVSMVDAVRHSDIPTWPASWPTDNRDGGVPDPSARTAAQWIQFGTEGGITPTVTVLPNQPVDYESDRRVATFGNVTSKTLFLGPAERADVVVDFSQIPAGTKLIIYNDAPAPVPGFDPRLDYYTGMPDMTDVGGAPTVKAGYGPNTRTIMQLQVEGSAAPAFDVNALKNAVPKAFAAGQHKPVVPEPTYNQAYGANYPAQYMRVQDTTMTFTPVGQGPVSIGTKPKLLAGAFDPDYGRMIAQLGVTRPFAGPLVEPFVPLVYIDPATETLKNTDLAAPIGTASDGTQLWKITNGDVDTHSIHFHLFDVQVVNRVGWDGMIKPPDGNELGWKDTVRMNPAEDIILALRPNAPTNQPFAVPDSVRPLDVTRPIGSTMGFSGFNAQGNPATIVNTMTNFKWEYVWHCHLLGHEEDDMMRPTVFQVAPSTPGAFGGSAAALSVNPPRVTLHWTNAAGSATTGITIQRATNTAFTTGLKTINLGPTATSYTDTTVGRATAYYYRVAAKNTLGISAFTGALRIVTPGQLPLRPGNLRRIRATTSSITIAWNNATTGIGRTSNKVQVNTVGASGPWAFGHTVNSGATGYTITGLRSGRTYWIRVLAVGIYGSTPSPAIAARTN